MFGTRPPTTSPYEESKLHKGKDKVIPLQARCGPEIG